MEIQRPFALLTPTINGDVLAVLARFTTIFETTKDGGVKDEGFVGQ